MHTGSQFVPGVGTGRLSDGTLVTHLFVHTARRPGGSSTTGLQGPAGRLNPGRCRTDAFRAPSALCCSSLSDHCSAPRPKLRFYMPRHQLRHLEHAHLLFAIENRFERLVGIDQRPLLGILELVLLDVVPQLLGEFTAGKGF